MPSASEPRNSVRYDASRLPLRRVDGFTETSAKPSQETPLRKISTLPASACWFSEQTIEDSACSAASSLRVFALLFGPAIRLTAPQSWPDRLPRCTRDRIRTGGE